MSDVRNGGHTVEPGEPPRANPAGKPARSALLGAMFLMATAAIGPGFITQTTVFTASLGAAFAFAILISIVVDIAVQMNVWRVLGVSGLRAQELGNKILPGVGWVLAALIAFGGLIFNVGNVAGGGLGLNALLGVDAKVGGAITAAVAIAIFLVRRAGVALDRIVVVLGLVMILLTCYTAIVSKPPLAEALRQTVFPAEIDFLAITTLIGGTVGGYITYAGAHRLIDSGTTGVQNIRQISGASVTGIIVTGIMRVLLFLAVLGVVVGGVTLAAENPAATAFQAAAGELGLRLFDAVLWAAAITSVIGASYTSVSFLSARLRGEGRRRGLITCGFIVVSTGIFLLINQAPPTLLILAGALNGLVLPIGFTVILWAAWFRRDLLGGYRYPRWLLIAGVAGWAISLFLGWMALGSLGKLWS
ncbi:divalent metal cation transporter [Acaricomes phytoseiuli]|uniref:NRAMP family divalent metal transporter n=2 Tax=Acaricomes phytoseiuli TaxID=291968 RepID=UPI002223676C|nr:NRAMP family divalent metal transporter [Acaricomes phytoseiuli]MCW1250064.1 divalent metal cation transporter [Acaricomes phytoseiuli]